MTEFGPKPVGHAGEHVKVSGSYLSAQLRIRMKKPDNLTSIMLSVALKFELRLLGIAKSNKKVCSSEGEKTMFSPDIP